MTCNWEEPWDERKHGLDDTTSLSEFTRGIQFHIRQHRMVFKRYEDFCDSTTWSVSHRMFILFLKIKIFGIASDICRPETGVKQESQTGRSTANISPRLYKADIIVSMTDGFRTNHRNTMPCTSALSERSMPVFKEANGIKRRRVRTAPAMPLLDGINCIFVAGPSKSIVNPFYCYGLTNVESVGPKPSSPLSYSRCDGLSWSVLCLARTNRFAAVLSLHARV
ncbi:hypothetical protein J6590_004365 [Homalodisca vitripennis]|nr:hypothetical protein J6590_004365 [Homalodisca vitripennis]